MRTLTAVALALAVASPVIAAEKKDEKGGAAVGQYVDISPVALPVIADGRLINFVFVKVRLNLAASANGSTWRDKEPFFRDALIHTAYRQPFTVPTNYTQIDVPALKARMMGEAARIAGRGVVTSVELTGEPQPKRVSGLPQPKGAATGHAIVP